MTKKALTAKKKRRADKKKEGEQEPLHNYIVVGDNSATKTTIADLIGNYESPWGDDDIIVLEVVSDNSLSSPELDDDTSDSEFNKSLEMPSGEGADDGDGEDMDERSGEDDDEEDDEDAGNPGHKSTSTT